MKKLLVWSLALAMVLSVAFACFAVPSSADADADWATEYAGDVWAAVEKIGANAYTPKFSIRFGGTRVDYTGTVNFAENPQGSLVGGTISLENGVVTMENLVWNEPAYDAELILWGAAKVILKGETHWYGPINNWPGDPTGAYKEHGAYSPLLVTSEGGLWKSTHGSGNTVRNLDTVVIYGDITLDFAVGLFNKDASSDIAGVDASLRHTLVVAPQNPSTVSLSQTVILGGGTLNNLVFAGGSEITINKDKFTFFGVATAKMEVLDGTKVNVGGEFGEWSGTATSAGVPATISLKDGSSLNVDVVYTETNYPASFINDKVVCDDVSAYYVAGELVKGSEPDWATKYAHDVWNAVEKIGANAYTPKFSIRFGGTRVDYTGTVNFAENPQGSLVGGTISLENGVVTMENLVWNEPAYDAELILWGAAKVILKGKTHWYGPINNWPGDPTGAYKEHGAYSPLLVTSEGGLWKSSHGSGNTVRNLDTVVIYGDIALDFAVGLFNKDASSDIAGVDASLRHTLVVAPQNPSNVTLSQTVILGGGTMNNVIFAGGSEITINKDKFTFFGVATANMEILEGTKVKVGGEFGEWSGNANTVVPATISLKDGSSLSVDVVYTETNYPASFINDRIVCDATSSYYVGGELVKGPVPESSDTSSDVSTDSATDTATDTATDSATDTSTSTSTDSATDTATSTSTATDSATDTSTDSATDTSTDSSTDTSTDNTETVKPEIANDWATKYAEDLWAKIPASSYAKVRLRAGADYMTVGDKDYIADGVTVDFAATPFGNLVGGTITVKDGVVTMDGLKYAEGAKDSGLNLIFDNGAGKLMIKNCAWKGDVRGDWGNAKEQAIFVTSDNTGSIEFNGVNSFRVYDSLYIYGNIALNITGDCFWMQNACYTTGNANDGTLLIAPLKASSFKVTDAQLKNFVTGARSNKIIFAGSADSGLITIDLADHPFTNFLTSIEIRDAKIKVVGGDFGYNGKPVTVKGASELTAPTILGSTLTAEGTSKIVLETSTIDPTTFVLSGNASVTVGDKVYGKPATPDVPPTSDVDVSAFAVLALVSAAAVALVIKKKHI